MSLQEQARKLIDQAQTAIQAGNPQFATELLRQSIMYNGKDADAFLLLGIALAQTKMPADAENAFKKATALAPGSVKAHYNLAVHQYTEGQVQAALANARKSVELDPLHSGAKSLAERIETELGLAPGEQPKTTPAGNPVPVIFREGYESEAVDSVPFVERMGSAWLAMGWCIAAMSLIGLVVAALAAAPYASKNANWDTLVTSLEHDPRMIFLRITFFGSFLLGVIWTAMDAINRRGNLLWLLPQVFCGCTAFTWLSLPAYILFGRKESAA